MALALMMPPFRATDDAVPRKFNDGGPQALCIFVRPRSSDLDWPFHICMHLIQKGMKQLMQIDEAVEISA